MARRQLDVVERRAHAADGTLIHPQLLERYRRRAQASANYADNEAQYQDQLHAHFDLVLEANAAGRAELLRLHRTGEIDESTLHESERDLDLGRNRRPVGQGLIGRPGRKEGFAAGPVVRPGLAIDAMKPRGMVRGLSKRRGHSCCQPCSPVSTPA